MGYILNLYTQSFFLTEWLTLLDEGPDSYMQLSKRQQSIVEALDIALWFDSHVDTVEYDSSRSEDLK